MGKKNNQELENKFLNFLKENEFFWLHELRTKWEIVEPGPANINGSQYSQFYSLVEKFKKENTITCTERKNGNSQFISNIWKKT